MNQYPKRLIEVDLPIKRISAHARREKDMRLGHIPSMHIYPAARPTSACRAVICAALWFDPADDRCPESFRVAARDEMEKWGRTHRSLMSGESFAGFEKANRQPRQYEDNLVLRSLLLDFIADFANWDNSIEQAYLSTCRSLTVAAHLANGGETGTKPLLFDPFAGGGAIPLEGIRVGADVFASDLNPVSILINKVILQYVPKYGTRLSEEIKKWCDWAQKEAKKELQDCYPADPDGSVPIAFLWARTIACEGPACGAEVPLMRSLWLARKGKRVALKLAVSGKEVLITVWNPSSGQSVPGGTIVKGSVTCPVCGFTTPVASVRSQLKAKRGGSDTARLYAVVLDSPTKGRFFRESNKADLEGFGRAQSKLQQLQEDDASAILSEPLPPDGALGFRVQKYGMSTWGDLFNSRQALALNTYCRLVREYSQSIEDKEFADAVNACLALVVDRLADLNAALCVWQLNTPNTAHVFGRWALPMNWDYGEVNPQSGAGGSPESAVRRLVASIKQLSAGQMSNGNVQQMSADNHSLPDNMAAAFVTDPPYYDAMPYSDLLDFFYVWMKRTLVGSVRTISQDFLGPKDDECIVDESRGKDRTQYETAMRRSIAEGRRILVPSGIGVVVFAHKSTRGWEALLQAMIDAGMNITGSWPIDTEMGSRLRAKSSAALASSVHLVCRPREDGSGSLTHEVGDWRDILRELPARIHEWMPRLASEGVVGADAIFACLGPALEIFSRYSSVEKPNGDQVKLGEYLEHVWAAVSKEALNMIFSDVDATGFEEDARLTAMWLWTLFSGAATTEKDEETEEEEGDGEESGSGKKKVTGYVLEYDAARKIAQGLGADLGDLESIIEVKGDKARLILVSERARKLFGYDAGSFAEANKKKKSKAQGKLFTEMEDDEYEAAFGTGGAPTVGATTLDKVHQAMLLFGAGRSEAVKRFLVDDGVGNDERVWRLANALSALYPSGSEEKRWVDGVLARKKGLGF